MTSGIESFPCEINALNLRLRESSKIRINENALKLKRKFPTRLISLTFRFESLINEKEGGIQVKIVARIPGGTIVIAKRNGSVNALIYEGFRLLKADLTKKNKKVHSSKSRRTSHVMYTPIAKANANAIKEDLKISQLTPMEELEIEFYPQFAA